MKAIQLKGNHFEIGQQLGAFWGNWFEELRSTDNQLITLYLQWLTQAMPDYYGDLYHNTCLHFPRIAEEIAGMADGVNSSKLRLEKKVTPEHIFQRCIWEERKCVSAIVNSNDEYRLFHNLEDDPPPGHDSGVFPLCIAKVDLTGDNNCRFLSVSYPFGLMGTVGVNQGFAFQGNTIGNAGKSKRWSKRIPASVFQRALLEMTSETEITSFLESHHLALPGHNYIVFPDRAYSLEIRPVNISELAEHQFKLNPSEKPWHVHTNYFRDSKDNIDNDWLYERHESAVDWKYERLCEFFQQDGINDDVHRFFTAFADVNRRYTSASIEIEVTPGEATMTIETYFRTREKSGYKLDFMKNR